jgi:hypothetical protein
MSHICTAVHNYVYVTKHVNIVRTWLLIIKIEVLYFLAMLNLCLKAKE